MVSKNDRIRSYLRQCHGAVSGQGGHDHTFKVACAIVKGFDCGESEAMQYLSEWNAKCDPPWSDDELQHKIESALAAPDLLGAPGYLLSKELKELYSLPQSGKNAVVVTPRRATFDPELHRKLKIAMAGREKLETLPDWTPEQMVVDSPRPLPSDADDHFDAFLGQWEPDQIIWMGHVEESGSPAYSGHFAKPHVWRRRGIPDNGTRNRLWTSGGAYKEGSFSRSKDTMLQHRFVIVESDRLSYPRQGAILKYLVETVGLPLCMIVDTKGASLHGWFLRTHLTEEYIERLGLLLFGVNDGYEDDPNNPGKKRRKYIGGMHCDPATFRGSQPARLPGATRPVEPNKRGGVQKIIYLA